MFGRLSKQKRDLLDIPQLPKGYYWVLKEPKCFSAVQIRRRLFCWPWWECVASASGRYDRASYQAEIDYAYKQAQATFIANERIRASWTRESKDGMIK